MRKNDVIKIFESLSSPIRLDIFKLLVKYSPEGIVAGKIAEMLDIPANNLSFHLKELVNSGLITCEQEGRFQRYRAGIDVMSDVISYLMSECCCASDRAEICSVFKDKTNKC